MVLEGANFFMLVEVSPCSVRRIDLKGSLILVSSPVFANC